MKIAESRTQLNIKGIADLEKEIESLQKEYFNLRMQKASQQLSNPMQLRQTRRAIARAKTILIQKKARPDPVKSVPASAAPAIV
jgi:large subunit ribosomal protein L29